MPRTATVNITMPAVVTYEERSSNITEGEENPGEHEHRMTAESIARVDHPQNRAQQQCQDDTIRPADVGLPA
jgi:hypothetical protein